MRKDITHSANLPARLAGWGSVRITESLCFLKKGARAWPVNQQLRLNSFLKFGLVLPQSLWRYLVFFGRRRLRSRTPVPPPFSSMNSTPASSRARLIARSLAVVIDVLCSVNSALLIVVTPTADL